MVRAVMRISSLWFDLVKSYAKLRFWQARRRQRLGRPLETAMISNEITRKAKTCEKDGKSKARASSGPVNDPCSSCAAESKPCAGAVWRLHSTGSDRSDR